MDWRTELIEAKALVYSYVSATEQPVWPRDVVADLKEQGARERMIRSAIWQLIDDQTVIFNRDRQLELARRPNAPQ